MPGSANPLRIIGHKNPDTDSICSAIGYAHLKKDLLGEPAAAYRAGNINLQTAFVLSYFGVESPELLTDVYPKIEDIMIGAEDLITMKESDTLGRAQSILIGRQFSFLPVVDEQGKCAGEITALQIAGLYGEVAGLGKSENITVDLHEMVRSIKGRVLTKGPLPRLFRGHVFIHGMAGRPVSRDATAGGRADPCLCIVPHDAAVELPEGCRILILCGVDSRGEDGAEPTPAAARRLPDTVVIATSFDSLQTAVHTTLAMPLGRFIRREHVVFRPQDLVRTVQRQIGRYNDSGFVVVDDRGYTKGVITRVNFLDHSRFRVVLVDHNEFSQAVDGIEEAEIVEIIDHHRLGTNRTDSPITFINKVVGSTSTIVAEIFHTRGLQPSRAVAGLLLSAILSDTVILKSPTTTELDTKMVEWLAGLARIDPESFGEKMFAEGSSLQGRAPQDVIRQDRKLYTEEDWQFSVSQIEVVGFKKFLDMKGEFEQALGRLVEAEGLRFACLIVTDITQQASDLLYVGARSLLDAITYPELSENLFEMKGVISRKKQVIPYLLDILRSL